jgi:hypothetical protein
LGIKTRLNTIEGVTGSYATTGSNVYQGNQTITGSLYISQNLIVAGSSSIQYITSSQLTIGDNIISLNANTPALRFSGLEVIDSGSSPQVSGSLLFDSVDNEWIFVHQATNAAAITSSTVITGPETLNNLGNETHLTDNRVPKMTNGFHIVDSNIVDDGTTIRTLTNTEVTGTLKITGTIVSTGTSIFSGSGQVIASLPAGTVSSSAQTIANLPAGTVSGSSQVLAGTTIHSGSFFNGISVVSGSAQIDGTAITNKSITIAGTSTSLGGSITAATILTSTGVWSGSAQLPSGTVSGSSQVLSGTGIWSGSAQLPSGVISGSAQVVSSLPAGTVSGSLQIIAGLPSGTVSGSSQITLSATTGFGTYLNQAVLTSSAPSFSGLTSTGVVTVGTIQAFAASGFGYDTNGYKTLIIGPTGNSIFKTLTFGVDVSGNSSGAFSGSGNEYVWRNAASFITPNAANTAYNTLFGWNSSGQITVSNAATFSSTMAVNNTATFTVSSGNNLIIEKSGGGAIAYTKSSTNSLLLEDDGGKLGVYSWNGSGWSQSASINTGTTIFTCSVSPEANGTRDLGSASYRWSTVYTSDLSLSNGIGDYTIVEGENDLFLYNNKQNKVYKFMLQEVDPNLATPKKSSYEF